MRLFVVRHGESGWNRAGLIQGQSRAAPGLTATGRVEAEAAAIRLSGSGAALVLTSGLRRALETGAILAAGLGVPCVLDPRLEERALGVAEGMASAGYPAAALGVGAGAVVDPDAAPAGGESVRALLGRVAGLLEDVSRWRVPAVVLSTHGGVVRAARALVEGEPAESMRWEPVPNAAIVELDTSRLARHGPFSARRPGAS